MPPIVILDSDDEDEDGSFSPPPNIQAPFSFGPAGIEAQTEAANDSSGGVSRAMTSTNPSFFQNIYNEQNDAARGYVPEPTARSHDQDQHSVSSSEMTTPAPFKRTVTGLIEPSSMPSARDQTTKRGQTNGNGPDEWTQASTPGRRKAPMAVMDDMWDVPSSPDERPVRPKIKLKVESSKAQSDSTSDSRHTQESDKRGKTPSSKSGRSDGSPSGKKRRRVSHPEPSFQGSNEVDLVAIPFSYENEGEYHESQPAPTPSMLPPTLPVNQDDSFFITTNPLTDAQKLEYESVQLPSSDSQNHQLPLVRQFEINLASSGDATNINTPRSHAHYLMSTAPPPPSSVMDPNRAAIGQATGNRWDSSPDVISAIDSPPKQKATRQLEQIRNGDSPKPANDETTDEQQPEQPELPAMQEEAFDNYEPDKVTKTKKSRGRPKKKAIEEPTTMTEAPSPRPEVVTPVTKPKKKRGRPRKSDQTDTREESPKIDPSASTNDASLSEDAVRPEKRPKIDIDESESKDELADESEMEPSLKSKSRESSILKDSDPNILAKSVSRLDDDAASKASDAATEEKEEKPEKRAITSRSSTPSKGLSAIINKPVYRVGLSKKSRIAPLLKCLRKE
ncbi:hypothetical protein FOPG_04372 [Fusarium oxysporum f. sp. conglutinans race 2 54008]|uniref:AT hook domain-containing protein n=3 Tax=Fusarium oxysporum f. sp. conglutinans TaxID=100902 RepID=A0A8H6LHA1_FUSOX|nr:hypothetical protein FOXB_12228 [Fusarium oxysporum f. sp. conglutinans Fo5176]EXL82971.1 hypothetical protein FOPG_04372 [Fusarium oxysporum f. sp. conglutinans race 2 54008]KAF6519303.1 hypothetical protein HZS61_017677 [Fusarium oxysporum f. sp. conglutinans]KAI8405477.1 hypothetical protein FOFC_14957 [Fusarium oxysporum]